MKAYQLTAWGAPPELRDVEVPEPGQGEVLIKIGGAGVCHSDLHMLSWSEGTVDYDLPFTLGHENAGWVEETGAGVEGLERGDPVAVYGVWGCGRCPACRRSAENRCERRSVTGAIGGGLGRDGGMAEYMLVPHERWLLPLGDLDPREAAPLSDAALTPYHAVNDSLRLLAPGSTAVVIGIGGLGHLALQILRALRPGVAVIAIDALPDRLRLALELGADEALPSGTGTGASDAVRDLTGGCGVELVLDNVGAPDTLALAAKVLRPGGHLAVIGLAGGLASGLGPLPFECRLTRPFGGTIAELIEVLALARAGKIKPRVERFPLEQAAEAYARLREGSIDGRAVLCPHG